MYADKLISELGYKLSRGWNPWMNVTNYRGYMSLDDVFERYLESVAITSRQKTIHSYTSRVNIFKEFLASLPVQITYIYQFC